MDTKLKELLIGRAREASGLFPLNGFEFNSAGAVGAALATEDGAVYTGINMDIVCGIGFCAEHAAIALMLKDRKTRIRAIAAVRHDGQILPPCGRCRELMVEVDSANAETEVVIENGETMRLADLLPHRWNTL